MMVPVIFLSFANDRDAYLPLVNRERKNISRSFRTHDELRTVKVVAETSTTLEDIFELFQVFNNQVAIFHFGGHAGGTHLQLEKADSSSAFANAGGLAKLLGLQENLQLVFLNGCATQLQVQSLLDQGVKAVIATSVPIQDHMATEFAEQFYNSLASHTTIRRAFNVAKAFIEAKYGDKKPVDIYRDFVFQNISDTNEMPWGLYLHPDHEDAAFWALPKTSVQKNVLRTRFDYETHADVNDILIDAICDELAKYNKDLDYELNKEDFDIPSIKREIVDSFPTPIGEQLRKLFTRSNNPEKPDDMERFTLGRLEQLTLTYRTTAQFVCFAALSQLWDAIYDNPELKISEDHIVGFNSFFAQNSYSHHSFDYFKLLRAIGDLFDFYHIPYFIEELNDVKIDIKENREVYDSYVYLNSVYEKILDEEIDPHKDDLESLCSEAEEHLGVILKEFAFLVKYKLATIKNIELIKNRHEPARFRHVQILLNQALTVASTGITEVGVEFDNYSDNKCVLFLKTKNNQIQGYLNLTPFIIDENALNSDYNTKLFLYSYQEEGNYCYQFLNNFKDPPLKVNDYQYYGLKTQFERFKASVFGYQYKQDIKGKKPGTLSRFARKKRR